jgi:hypothetical protein
MDRTTVPLVTALVTALLLPATLAACGGPSAASPASAPGADPRDLSAAEGRLQGSWRLVDFRPEVAPEPMFQALLASQVGALVVKFDHGQLYADSPTFHTTRAYRVVTAAGPLFTVESPDAGGAVFTSSCTISEDGVHITFRGDSDPWRGTGSLARVP